MLDSITKKRIDDLRDILVGKIPSPQSQVEQITTGLIYKFMYDMDQEAVEMGGIASFFIGDYEKYAWKNLFDPKLSGIEKVQLYGDAIEHMYTNPTAPQLFREIFKNSFLPFKDPATLNMFLKEINQFHYSHSEKLGDAFEYLLSFMGSQGDAGQFRTPRHIIDFVVDIINPQKNESILDPACGTAGFLISSYKHILKQNTNKKIGDKLTASDRKKIGDNLVGYDISPDMTRISLVNMYLHQFANPQIHEYDTLSSEDRWNEYYDVILANPPFFSPTGGIQPHSRFGIQSTRAEVLFIDYIMEHLKPNGRAGIIVPEGIIFQTGSAYKTLRKKLLGDSLVGVISLPSGVFQPYSGVKTSILILDKSKSKEMDAIYFAKIDNDGFSLSTQRTVVDGSELPSMLEAIRLLDKSKLKIISKLDIENDSNVSLSPNSYDQLSQVSNNYPMVKIGDVFKTSSGGTPTSSNEEYYKNGDIPWVRSGEVDGQFIRDTEIKITQKGLENSSAKLFPPNSVLIAMYGATAGKVGMLEIEASTNQAVCAIYPNDKCLPKYLYYVLRSQEKKLVELSVGGAQPNISQTIIKNFLIPLPPLDIQGKIVEELNGYNKIISGCFDVINNYTPIIKIDDCWDKLPINQLGETKSGGTPLRSNSEYWDGNIPWYSSGELNNLYTIDSLEFITEKGISNSNCKIYPKGSLLIGMYDTAAFKMSILDRDATFNQAIFGITTNNKINVIYLYLYLMTQKEKYLHDRVGVRQRNLSKTYIDQIEVSVPPLSVQEEIVGAFQDEISLIEGCNQLIQINTQKIQTRINDVWERKIIS